MLTLAILVALVVFAGDRIARAFSFAVAFAFNFALLVFTATLRLTLKG